ncbi:MAG: tetratricopeptide repeat protein [Myxococcales bacterium]|nr:tetratricopeptide repeat protein [Myxococcales bacterium]
MSIARADGPKSEEDPAAAAQAFRAGVAAAQAGRWKEALDAFDLSYRLRRHPNTLLNIAGAQAQTGKLVEAVESYKRFLAESANAEENQPARKAATDYATGLEKRFAHLKVEVANFIQGDIARVDGAPLPEQPPHETFNLNPGEHSIDVLRNDRVIVAEHFTLADGESKKVVLNAPLSVDPTTVLSTTAPAMPDDDGSLLEAWWFWTLVGVVVAAGTVTTIALVSADGGSSVDGGSLGTVGVP